MGSIIEIYIFYKECMAQDPLLRTAVGLRLMSYTSLRLMSYTSLRLMSYTEEQPSCSNCNMKYNVSSSW